MAAWDDFLSIPLQRVARRGRPANKPPGAEPKRYPLGGRVNFERVAQSAAYLVALAEDRNYGISPRVLSDELADALRILKTECALCGLLVPYLTPAGELKISWPEAGPNPSRGRNGQQLDEADAD